MVAMRKPAREFHVAQIDHLNLHPPWRHLRHSELEGQRLSNGDMAIRIDNSWSEHGPRTPWAYRAMWREYALVGFWDRSEARGLAKRQDESFGVRVRRLERLGAYLTGDALDPPSERERQVGELVVLEARTFADVADTLGLSVRTVESYWRRLRARAGVR